MRVASPGTLRSSVLLGADGRRDCRRAGPCPHQLRLQAIDLPQRFQLHAVSHHGLGGDGFSSTGFHEQFFQQGVPPVTSFPAFDVRSGV